MTTTNNKLAVLEETGTVVLSKEALRAKMKLTLKDIDKRLLKLQKGSSAQFKAPASFKLNENDQNNINIQTCVDICYLLKALSLMNRIKREYEQTAKELELVKYPVCLWCGGSVDAWIHDLKFRIGIVTNASTITSLTAARAKLETFLTEEDRLSITLKEIAALISS